MGKEVHLRGESSLVDPPLRCLWFLATLRTNNAPVHPSPATPQPLSPRSLASPAAGPSQLLPARGLASAPPLPLLLVTLCWFLSAGSPLPAAPQALWWHPYLSLEPLPSLLFPIYLRDYFIHIYLPTKL